VSGTKIKILGTLVDNINLAETISWIEQRVLAYRQNPAEQPPQIIVTANPEYVMLARQHPDFQALINQAGLVTPDGIGLLYAAKLLGKPFKGRVTGVALVQALAKQLSDKRADISLFLLGAGEGIAEKAAQELRSRYPYLKIVGTFAGNADAEGDSLALAHIVPSEPDIILVAYGQMKQDWWSVRNLDKSGAAIAIGVGGVFDYLSGNAKLAPAWMRKAGLEWFYRLYREPWRWRRQTALIRFVLAVVKNKVIQSNTNNRSQEPEVRGQK
jgi:N-acetylglucosaminyldiphosphoundecaprenol N-acetyl-beta-D-mannosaminyltransferase